jgi:hypothetical protein
MGVILGPTHFRTLRRGSKMTAQRRNAATEVEEVEKEG